jgi:hypothetical protein
MFMSKYTFSNWWSGDICLDTCPLSFNNDSPPKVCSINDFSDKDIVEIKKTQKEIWDDACLKYFNEIKSEYESKSKNNTFYKTFLEVYFFTLREKLNPYSTYYNEEHNKIVFNIPCIQRIEFDQMYFRDYRLFIENYSIKGNKNEYEFIHSPNCSYQLYSNNIYKILPQVYAHCYSNLFLLVEKDFNELTYHSNDKKGKEKNIDYTNFKNFKNNFNNTNESLLINYFYDELFSNNLIHELHLVEYLKSAFQLQEPPAKLFKFKSGVKKKVVYTIFYRFYRDIAKRPPNQKIRYAELLGNYFSGYDTNDIMKNFSRNYLKIKKNT